MVQTWIVESTERIEFDQILNNVLIKMDEENCEVVSMEYSTCFIPAKHSKDCSVLRSMIISYKKIEVTPEMLGETGQ